jgi:hypothetical protein
MRQDFCTPAVPYNHTQFRIYILLVLGTIPAVLGLRFTYQVILSITGYPPDHDSFKGREEMYEGML